MKRELDASLGVQFAMGNMLPLDVQLPPSVAPVTLLAKRRTAVARTMPRLARALDGQFRVYFDEYAESRGLSSRDAPLDDALAFSLWLERRALLPAHIRIPLRWRLRRALLRLTHS